MATDPKTDAFGRRIWDKSQYQTKPLTEPDKPVVPRRLVEESVRTHLKERDYELNLEKTIGQQKVITATAHTSQQGGYWCSVCECLLKDSGSYLDHLNGKKHNRTLGMSMRVKKASKEDVAKRLKDLKDKKNQILGAKKK
eukprot:Blabericola_migrator_1__2972@NODE_1859_length_3646_cov_357_337804_g1189_i0_p4_GENE_NODE_1859_length_3646_cov_357_337804_g1189_i0NODE_1859_length_3646_cov_357_337804_g1189_i0_p4_ORF_typecomplete_len140_score31_32zfC2H2_jaz/PF12171_8/1_6e05zfU1/PF06220_12/1_3e04zfU1/PF06220_12/0_00064zfmet/PF12874_7/1_1e04zfmet/PF12874_7/5e03zfmet/PF12874_7/0_0019CCDC84/PF14968_6/0_024_NODE_1859_length_3646_cov_357_337804_g1189_i07481167